MYFESFKLQTIGRFAGRSIRDNLKISITKLIIIHWKYSMQKILDLIKNLIGKNFWAFGLATLLFSTGLTIQSSYAANPVDRAAPDVIQPFELTNPAATRLEAYDDIAKLNNDPKALIAAENKEEQAKEKVYKAEQKRSE